MNEHIIEEQVTDRYFATMARELCGRAEVCRKKCNSKCNAYKYAVRAYAKGYRKQKSGFWRVGEEQGGVVYAKCSACGRKMESFYYGHLYCPLCGAAMDGERKV